MCGQLFTWPTDQPRHATDASGYPVESNIRPLNALVALAFYRPCLPKGSTSTKNSPFFPPTPSGGVPLVVIPKLMIPTNVIRSIIATLGVRRVFAQENRALRIGNFDPQLVEAVLDAP